MITSNRGLAGGYNGNVLRAAIIRYQDNQTEGAETSLEVAGKRGISFFRFRKMVPDATYTQFEDRPQFHEVEVLADEYIKLYRPGDDRPPRRRLHPVRLVVAADRDRADAAADHDGRYRPGRPVGPPVEVRPPKEAAAPSKQGEPVPYEFLPDARSILEEIVPVSFKVRLFKCFLDAAVSEQIARMVAMGGATKNADDLVKSLTRQYNRARQNQITRELADIVGAAARSSKHRLLPILSRG